MLKPLLLPMQTWENCLCSINFSDLFPLLLRQGWAEGAFSSTPALWLLAVKMLSWFVLPACLSSTSQVKLPLMCFTKICQPGLHNQEVQPVNQTALLLCLSPRLKARYGDNCCLTSTHKLCFFLGTGKWRLELDRIFLGFILFWDISWSEFVVPCNSFYSFGCAQITSEVGKTNQTLLLLELYLQVG